MDFQGKPYPENEANAVDVVIQFAIHRLGFELKDIVLFAWSIGGFTASLAAEEYPDIGAVVSINPPTMLPFNIIHCGL